MKAASRTPHLDELYSADEIAQAARVPTSEVDELLAAGRVVSFRGYIPLGDAIRLARMLAGRTACTDHDRVPLAAHRQTVRRRALPFTLSLALHGALLALLLGATALGLLSPNDTEEQIPKDEPIRLVYLMVPGPGGGGGGGGLKAPTPPPRARRQAPPPLVRKVSSPIPPVRKDPPPRTMPRSVELARMARIAPIDNPKPPPPPVPAPPAVVAPVVPVPADPIDVQGLPSSTSTKPSPGPGTGSGVGSGAGTGLGSGDGAGIGPGSGGGTGGGPFQPGSGIMPPTLVREVRPGYTDEARRRAIEGDVILEIVVQRDGSVGRVRVTRSLGAGLDQKAVEAVRQWRFGPARRQGAAVDVVVEVSVEFKLR